MTTNIQTNTLSEPPPKLRKLEFFEKELKRSEAGRCVLEIIQAHGEEVIYLVNHNRRVATVWQRYKGPAFIQAVVDSGFEDDVTVPKVIEGIALSDLLLRMADALQQSGSQKLIQIIGTHTALVLQWAEVCNSLQEMFALIHSKGISE